MVGWMGRERGLRTRQRDGRPERGEVTKEWKRTEGVSSPDGDGNPGGERRGRGGEE